MIILIPLGGIGERFKKHGYSEPKALIKVNGKPILFYLLDALEKSDFPINMIYIPYNKEYQKYRLEDLLRKSYKHLTFRFFPLEYNTEGAAETIYLALKELKEVDQPILCMDGDNFYKCDVLPQWNGQNAILSVHNTLKTPIYSYLKLDGNKVLDIVEKEKISDLACTGGYGFASYFTLLKYCGMVLEKKIKQKNEYYTSTVIKQMIQDNHAFVNINVQEEDFVCIGTPIQLKLFYHIHCQKKAEKPMRLCFDLDNTLVSFPKVSNDYSSVEPIQENIDYLNYLKQRGHTIIIYTARRMKTHNGNVGKILNDVGMVTFQVLEQFNIQYDEIYFGKPYADVYIDDLAINCFDNIEKKLGIYQEEIKPRDFNQLSPTSRKSIIKKSENLAGEIYYYQHLPTELQSYFPKLHDYDMDNKWYEMEKLEGVTLSILYVNELLTRPLLLSILESVQTIHQLDIPKSQTEREVNIYANYSQKLQRRYENYDYGDLPGSQEIYSKLKEFLDSYESTSSGKKTLIHGDPVFSNIIIGNDSDIKFFDMRGVLGNTLTMCGDHNYDWAKIYQSLLGYDAILLNREISASYQQDLIQCFEAFYIKHFGEKQMEYVKQIAYSFLFSLLPLHENNDKIRKYYNLIPL